MNKIENLYEHYDEENRLERTRESSIECLTTLKFLSPYLNKSTKVLEIGCGAGYYGLQIKNKIKSYTGLDICQRNIKEFELAIKETNSKNLKAVLGDALCLPFENEKYDLVLNLGPLYHLNKKNAEKSINESIRVCKKNGIIAFAYMNKFGNFVKLCAQECFIGLYPTHELLENILKHNTDDEGLFFFTTPEEIEAMLKSAGLKILKNLTTDGVTMHHHRISDFRDDEFNLWKEFHFATCEEPSIRGMGDHGLIICQKVK